MKTRTLINPYLQLGSLLLFQCFSANAVDLTAASADPYLLFRTTPANNNEWLIRANQDEFKLFNYDTSADLLWFDDGAEMQLEMAATAFQIEDQSGNTIVNVHRDAPLSLDIQSDGDVSMAGGSVFIDGTFAKLGIGTNDPSFELHIASQTPNLMLDSTTTPGWDWRVGNLWSATVFGILSEHSGVAPLLIHKTVDMQITMEAGSFQIDDEAYNPIFKIHRDAPLSLDILDNGDISFANGDVFIDKSNNRLGIGTTIPKGDLNIVSTSPGIHFDDTSAFSPNWFLGNSGNKFVFHINENETGGPLYTTIMSLAADTGFVGINMYTPTAALHVGSPDTESAKVLVENTTTTVAPRTLFELKNPGNTKFTVNNTDAAVQWAFANPGTGFRLSRQGSGFVEFEVFNNGDARLEGVLVENSDVNSKQGIEAIDTAKILEKVVAMPISQWRYKDAPDTKHLGPMAQDFHAAFGLGNTDKGISTLDSSGVALAAIQGLEARLTEQDRKFNSVLAAKDRQIESLERRIADMESNLEQVVSVLISNSRVDQQLVALPANRQ